MSKVTLAALLWLLANGAAPAKAQAKDHRQDQRRLWAYPKGVIVTTDGGQLSPVKRDDDKRASGDKNAADKPADKAAKAADKEPEIPDDFRALVKGLEQKLEACLAAWRDAHPELAQRGGRFDFALDFTVGADGRVYDATLQKASGSDPLPDCADQARQAAASGHLEPAADLAVRHAHVQLDGLVLTDEDAQGRGYRYYTAESAWDAAVKAHPEWFACRRDADCTAVAERCEVRAVNAAHLEEYHRAVAGRAKGPCDLPPDLNVFAGACRRGRCAAAPRR